MNTPTMTLYGTPASGHAHRVELLLRMLELPFAYVEAPAPVRRTAEFRKLNPLGQIPVLSDGELVLCDGELVLCDSNAIMVYLVKRYAPDSAWLPDEPVAAAQVQRWLAIAAGELRYGPAAARMALQWGMPEDPVRAAEIADRLLRFMDSHLTGRSFLAAEQATLADLACYAYVAHAPEGGISLAPFPQVRAWLERVEALPRFKDMPILPLKVGA